MTFGVFQSYLQTHPPFENSRYIPVVGVLATVCLGGQAASSPKPSTDFQRNIISRKSSPYTLRYQTSKYQRHMICIGWLICIIALLASSFATKVWHLMLTQGFLYGVGVVILYYPVLSIVNEWFVKRRGLAYGLM